MNKQNSKEESFEEWDRRRVKNNKILFIISAMIAILIMLGILWGGGIF